MCELRIATGKTQGGVTIEQRLGADADLRVTGYGGTRAVRQYLAFPGTAPTSSGGVTDLDRSFGGVDGSVTARFPLAGRPLLEHHIRNLNAAGCEAVMVNTHHLHEQIEAFISSSRFDIPVSARWEPEILGTGGAIRNAKDFWDQRPFFVINADIVSAIDLGEVYAFHLRHRPAATLVLTDHPDFNTVCVDAAGRIRAFAASTSEAPAGALTFTGAQVLDPAVLEYIPAEGYAHSIDVFRAMIADGRDVRGFIVTSKDWMDVGTPERYRLAAREASAREAWRLAFASGPPASLTWERLEGDGSDRQWSRMKGAGGSLVLADHGLRSTTAVTSTERSAPACR